MFNCIVNIKKKKNWGLCRVAALPTYIAAPSFSWQGFITSPSINYGFPIDGILFCVFLYGKGRIDREKIPSGVGGGVVL